MTDPMQGAMDRLDKVVGGVFDSARAGSGDVIDPMLSDYLKIDEVDLWNLVAELGLKGTIDYVKEMEMRRVENEKQ